MKTLAINSIHILIFEMVVKKAIYRQSFYRLYFHILRTFFQSLSEHIHSNILLSAGIFHMQGVGYVCLTHTICTH